LKSNVRRTIASSLLSLLLLTVLVWGGCVSCEQYFMWPGAKSCCAADGHCKKKTPTEKNAGRECKQIAFEHQRSVDLPVDLPMVVVPVCELPLRTAARTAVWRCTAEIEPSPPDLQVLHSTFLI
jgi:hypothetical protein